MLRTKSRSSLKIALGVLCLITTPACLMASPTRDFATAKTLTVTIASSASEYGTSADVLLSFVARNISNRDVRLLQFPGPQAFDLVIKDSSGVEVQPNVPRNPYHPLAFSGPTDRIPMLKANASEKFVNEDGSSDQFQLTSWGYSLPSGIYTLYAQFRGLSIQTNSLTIKIDN